MFGIVSVVRDVVTKEIKNLRSSKEDVSVLHLDFIDGFYPSFSCSQVVL